MSNNRYTGPSASNSNNARKDEATQFFSSFDPVEEVNKIIRELGLDERYFVDETTGRVGSGYGSLTAEERFRASEEIQRRISQDYAKKRFDGSFHESASEVPTTKQAQVKKSPKRRIRKDRVVVAGMIATMLASLGFTAAKNIIAGVKGDPQIAEDSRGSSVSDNIITDGDFEGSEATETPDIVPDIDNFSQESEDAREQVKEDKIAYVIDFCDYYNASEKEHIFQMIDGGMIDGIGFEIGGSCVDYPFTIRTFDDSEIKSQLQRFVDEGEVELQYNFGEVEWLEEYLKKSDVAIPYYYTCALNNEEAEIEAACIDATYQKLYRDMPDYDFKDRMGPIAIDIEVDVSTEAVLHLIDCLSERGVIDERGVIIYFDENRVKDYSYIDWNELFAGIKARNINCAKWGTRALSQTVDSEIEYSDIYTFRDALMNTSNNIMYMKSDYDDLGLYLGDIAMQQIHLNQQIETTFTYPERYDVNITTANTLKAIVHGEEISYEKGLIDRIEDVRMQEVKKDLEEGKVNNNSSTNRGIDDVGDRE